MAEKGKLILKMLFIIVLQNRKSSSSVIEFFNFFHAEKISFDNLKVGYFKK